MILDSIHCDFLRKLWWKLPALLLRAVIFTSLCCFFFNKRTSQGLVFYPLRGGWIPLACMWRQTEFIFSRGSCRIPGVPGGGGLTLHHAPVGRVCDRVDVRRHFVSLLALIHFNDLLRVDGEVLVGVYDHTEEARVRLQHKRRFERFTLLLKWIFLCFYHVLLMIYEDI